MYTFQFCGYLREALESTYIFLSLKEDWNFSGENCQKLGCFCITKIRLKGDIFEEKSVNKTFY